MIQLTFLPRGCAAAMALLAVLASAMAADAAAESFTTHEALDDVTQYVTAPLRWDLEDWTYFGVTAAAVAAAHAYDRDVRAHFTKGSATALDGQDKNSLRDAAPTLALIAGTWAYAGLIDDRDGYREGWALLEAGVFSVASGEVLKLASGRERPDVTASPNEWRHGGDSFPSVHVSAAFAVGTVFAESGNDEYRWLRRALGYGIAFGTAYVRLHDNEHWLSDTVAGAALGIATARFVLNRQPGAKPVALNFQPSPRGGWMLSCTVGF